MPFRIVPERGQRPEYTVETASEEGFDVLHDDDAWSYLANESDELEEQSAARAVEARSVACDADVLTRESAAHDVDVCVPVSCKYIRIKRANVSVSLGLRPANLKYSLRKLVDLNLPHRSRAW